jgi:hypothetical protein
LYDSWKLRRKQYEIELFTYKICFFIVSSISFIVFRKYIFPFKILIFGWWITCLDIQTFALQRFHSIFVFILQLIITYSCFFSFITRILEAEKCKRFSPQWKCWKKKFSVHLTWPSLTCGFQWGIIFINVSGVVPVLLCTSF